MTKVSIIVPCYNEEKFIKEIINKVQAVHLSNLTKEIIVVDDGSNDGSPAIIQSLRGIKCVFHGKNLGKGAAIRTALALAGGDLVLIQDADLEYDPNDYSKLLAPIIGGWADVVYGSRFRSNSVSRFYSLLQYLANKFFTFLNNGLNQSFFLTDIETCYKAFKKEAIASVIIEESGFGFEPEITIKLLKRGWRFHEVGISYAGRSYAEGKKIKFKDGLRTIFCIFKYTLKH